MTSVASVTGPVRGQVRTFGHEKSALVATHREPHIGVCQARPAYNYIHVCLEDPPTLFPVSAVDNPSYDALYGPGGATDPVTGERLVTAKRPGMELVIAVHKAVAELGVLGRAEDIHAIMAAERDATLSYPDTLELEVLHDRFETSSTRDLVPEEQTIEERVAMGWLEGADITLDIEDDLDLDLDYESDLER